MQMYIFNFPKNTFYSFWKAKSFTIVLSPPYFPYSNLQNVDIFNLPTL